MSFRSTCATLLCAFLGLIGFLSSPAEGASPPPYAAENDLIEVMFAPESRVRLRSGDLVDLATNALDGLAPALNDVLPITWSRIADVPEVTLDDIQARAEVNTGGDIYNLNNVYRLHFNPAAIDVWTLSARLEALPGVLLARPVPKPMPAPLPPDFQPNQNYEDAAWAIPTGVDAEYAWTLAGGNGTGITICDLEYSWNYNHDDLTSALGSQINTNVVDPFSDMNHGTAVIGEMVSDDNSPNWGTKGICYGADLKTCGTYFGTPSPSWNVPGALAVAIANLQAGDIILLEQQWAYTSGGNDHVPIEWWLNHAPGPQTMNPVYAAIVNAVGIGIHVVEAGGNGNVDTGTLTWFGDSGAVIVGAGGAYPGGTAPEGNLERLFFSSYGPRFNLQGWGENVVTTGYGSLYGAEGVNRYYTSSFNGTSSAAPVVVGAMACVQGYYLANLSATPLSPGVMRNLLVTTGRPQFFGLAGSIGPRPDCFAAIQALNPQPAAEYGDAPENALAYPATGVIGQFPTCAASGAPGSFISHAIGALSVFFGPAIDYEPKGNGGRCSLFPPYDWDECWNDGDSGLMFPPAYTIDPSLQVVPCDPATTGCMGVPCATANWGSNLDILVTNQGPTMFVNVLMDWNQDGVWGGAAQCQTGSAPEHVLVNFPVPGGFVGPLSALAPPGFLIGPNRGHVWTRFTIGEHAVPANWDGSGIFQTGETCDFLLCAEEPRREYGDAPEGAPAYPALGVVGAFPTCMGSGPAGFVAHQRSNQLYFGPMADLEFEGNAGNCPNFPPYDADECWNDGDSGLLAPGAFTIAGGTNVVPCTGAPWPLGNACTQAVWGPGLDIQVTNGTGQDAFVNVLMDWNQDGAWSGGIQCPIGFASEHVLTNFIVPAGFAGVLSLLGPPGFLIGPNLGYVWSRWTVSDAPVGLVWDGSGTFVAGETSDYLLKIGPTQVADYGDAPEGAIAYPAAGTMGMFPTCVVTGPSGYVAHGSSGGLFLGPTLDAESDGNAGLCPNFPPYDADECWNDGDAGLLFPGPFTINGALNIVPCPLGPVSALGRVCNPALWGANLDLQVTNFTVQSAFVNVLIDWNQDGVWFGASTCPAGAAAEHVLMNLMVPAGFTGPLSLLGPPGFLIGPNAGHVWSRFTLSDSPVVAGWDGSGTFLDGETSDYLLEILPDVVGLDLGNAPITATRIVKAGPNPFGSTTTIGVELAGAGKVSAGIYDVAGRRIRSLLEGEMNPGRYQITWDGRNNAGARVASGMYFFELRTADRTYTKPLLLTR